MAKMQKLASLMAVAIQPGLQPCSQRNMASMWPASWQHSQLSWRIQPAVVMA